VLAFHEDTHVFEAMHLPTVELGREGEPPAVGARLYAALREADAAHAGVILAREIAAGHPLSAAIRDRLRRAAAK